MLKFFVEMNVEGMYGNDHPFAVVCVQAIVTTLEEDPQPMFVCGCNTIGRADEISRMYNYFAQMKEEEDV